MKSQRKAPTPEREVRSCAKKEGIWMDIIEQKSSVQKVGGHCDLIRGYSIWKPRRST